MQSLVLCIVASLVSWIKVLLWQVVRILMKLNYTIGMINTYKLLEFMISLVKFILLILLMKEVGFVLVVLMDF